MKEVIQWLPSGAQKELGKRFNVSRSYVSSLLNGNHQRPYQTKKAMQIKQEAIRLAAENMAKDRFHRMMRKYMPDVDRAEMDEVFKQI